MNSEHVFDQASSKPLARRPLHFDAPDPWLVGGVAALLALLCVALFGERIAPYEPIYFVVEHGGDPRPYDPGIVFPFGSDVLGRDLFSMVLAGARATLAIVLISGAARVLAGAAVAAVGSWWRPARLLTETVAELVAAIPATLVALILVKAFVKTDTSVLLLIGALLLTGWAGPYRVIRAELDRLARAPFTEGAMALGASRWRLLWRHQLPHLAPAIAMNLTQQVVASLVLVAELGVLGVLVGAVRMINIEESLTAVRVGPPISALVPDLPEWGAMLASSRTVEALWTTRWLIFVPGVAFALTAITVAAIGFALARRYARRDLWADGRGAAAVAFAALALVVSSNLVPERYIGAREWVAAARSEVRSTGDLTAAFNNAGLRTYTAVQERVQVVRSGPASVTMGGLSVAESYPFPQNPAPNTTELQSLVGADASGGFVDAPLVFAARGIVPADGAPRQLYKPRAFGSGPDLAPLISGYPDDYADIDVRGKVVLLVRFMGVDTGATGLAAGPVVHDSISDAITRGAAAVIFIDPDLGSYRDRPSSAGRAPMNPYTSLEREFPATRASGVPVVVLAPTAAQRLVGPLGVDLAGLVGPDILGKTWERSAARDLGISARVSVPLREETEAVPSFIAEVPGTPEDAAQVVVFAARNFDSTALDAPRADAMAALARVAAARHAPFIFVDFDARADSRAVRAALAGRRIALVVVLESLAGNTLHFATANGDLIPAIDLYAEKAGARFAVTRRTAGVTEMAARLPGVKTIAIHADGEGDARADAAAVIAYAAGRLALGAPELR